MRPAVSAASTNRIAPAGNRRRNQPEDKRAEAQQHKSGSAPIKAWRCLRIAALRQVTLGDPDCRQREQRIYQKYPAPAEVIDNPSA
jgi:hypothetical protein